MVTETKKALSMNPETFAEGGGPVTGPVHWKECRFNLFQYTKKDGSVVMKRDNSGPATTVALRVTYLPDDGTESVQQYSAGDPERLVISPDGKSILPVVEGTGPTKSTNLDILLVNLVSAGYPANRLDGGDISVLDGLYTENIAVPAPARPGLVVPEGGREKLLSVPKKVLAMPSEKKGGKAKVKVAETTESDEGDDAISAKALELVKKAVDAGGGSTTRQKLASAIIRDKSLDQATRDAIAKLVFNAEFQVTLLSGGYMLDGESITANE